LGACWVTLIVGCVSLRARWVKLRARWVTLRASWDVQAHDANDFATGKRHDLPSINVFTDQGTLNENGAPFEGMSRFAVRVKVRDPADACHAALGGA
jgi:hypothetical protein